ncbi:MAG: hypothetical protein IKH60_04265 [Bacteroidales bacterium]|nr:hypothetical protein [Bacteroidales bacterium]
MGGVDFSFPSSMPRKRKRQAIQDPNQLLLFSLEEMAGDSMSSDAAPTSSETTQEASSDATEEVSTDAAQETPSEAKVEANPEATPNSPQVSGPDMTLETEPETIQQAQPEKEDAVTVEPTPEWMGKENEEDTIDLLTQVIKLLEDFDAGELRLIAMQSTALMQGGIRNEGIYRIPALPDIMLSGNVLKGIAYVSIVQSFPSMIEKIGLHWEKEYAEALKKVE